MTRKLAPHKAILGAYLLGGLFGWTIPLQGGWDLVTILGLFPATAVLAWLMIDSDREVV